MQQLAEVFFKSGMIEAWGRSFEKISEACKQQHAPLPKLDISKEGMMVHCLPCERYLKLMNQNNTDTKTNTETDTETSTKTSTETDTEKNLLKLISNNPMITIQQMANITGLSVSGVRYALGKLRDRGVVDRKGAQKRGKWVIRP